MKKAIIAGLLAGSLSAGIVVGVDTGKYTKDGTDLYAQQFKAGYNFEPVTVYGFYEYDKLDTLKGNMYGAGVDYNGGITNELGFVVGASYGEGDVQGFDYKDKTGKAGLTYSFGNGFAVEGGYKFKNMEILGSDSTLKGAYIGITYEVE